VAAALTGDRAAEPNAGGAAPGVLAVLRFGAFHRWIDQEDLTQETLHVVVERVRARTIDDPRKVFAFAAATARTRAERRAQCSASRLWSIPSWWMSSRRTWR
jgi:hypothetical protein